MLRNQDILARLKGYMHLVYLALGIVLVCGSIYFHLKTQLTPLLGEWGQAITQTERMRTEASRLQVLQGRLPVLIQTAADGRRELLRVQDYLPHQKDFPGLISQISLAANQYNVQLTEITASELNGDAEISPVALQVSAVATYPDLLRFLATLERLERIVTIREITVLPHVSERNANRTAAAHTDLVAVDILLASYSLVSPASDLAAAAAETAPGGTGGDAAKRADSGAGDGVPASGFAAGETGGAPAASEPQSATGAVTRTGTEAETDAQSGAGTNPAGAER